MRQFKNRVGLKGAYSKYKKYMKDFDFIDFREADRNIDWSKAKVVDIDSI